MPAFQRALRRVRAALGWGENARESERRRIAADLHDGPLQSVIALEMRLAAARSLVERDPSAAQRELAGLAEAAAAVVAELRAFQRTLSPPPLATTDLGALLGRLVEDFTLQTGIQAQFEAPQAPVPATPEVCLEVAQILREALTNVRKHAQANRVLVRLAEGAQIIVEDNGVGFPWAGKYKLEELEALGAGPRSIMQRVSNLGGELTLESRPGQGSRLEIRVPV